MTIARLTPRQREANRLLASPARHIMIRGGSRSGKTFILVRALIQRALNAPESRHVIFRFRFNAAKTSVWSDTIPKVLKLCFPDLRVTFNKTDFFVVFPNGSQIWIAGLDDKERVEKILGQEFVTIYINEASQVPWASIEMALSRLAQNCPLDPSIAAATGKTHLALKAYYDCVAGETVLDGHSKTIAELAEAGEPITVMTTHGPRLSSAPWLNGYGEVFTVTTSTGRTIRATASHRFWTRDGWKRLDAMTIGHELLCTSQGPSPDGELDARLLTRTPSGSLASCCKCHRRCDGRLHPVGDACQACPASAYDEGPHTHSDFHRDGSGSHKGRPDQPEAQHIRRSQSFRGLLSRACDGSIGRIPALCGRRIFGSSQQKCRSSGLCQTKEARQLSAYEPPAISRPRLNLAWYWQTALDAASIGKQWLRCNLLSRLSLDRKAPDHEGLKSLSLAPDTPIVSGHEYETVVDISQPTIVSFYTVDVPFSRHYLANGFVSHNCNPPSKLHWSYQLFRAKVKPGTKESLPNPDDYAEMKVNPSDNSENLPPAYFEVLASMSAAKRLRFEAGEWASEVNGALWALEDRTAPDGKVMPGIDSLRVAKAPEMRRIVVAVDPSGGGDDIGIVVAGIGVDGDAYVMEDVTCNMSPEGWGRRAVEMYHKWGADRIVGERNYGGDMVASTIRTADKTVSYHDVVASRGKHVRAEPISALYEQRKVHHVGQLPDLEDELCNFTASGYIGDKSPNRADALVWAITELMLGDTGYDWSTLL